MNFVITIADKKYTIYHTIHLWYTNDALANKFACGRHNQELNCIEYLTKNGEWRQWTNNEDWFDTVGDIVNLLMKHVVPTEAEISAYEKAKDIVDDFEMKYHR